MFALYYEYSRKDFLKETLEIIKFFRQNLTLWILEIFKHMKSLGCLQFLEQPDEIGVEYCQATNRERLEGHDV